MIQAVLEMSPWVFGAVSGFNAYWVHDFSALESSKAAGVSWIFFGLISNTVQEIISYL